MFANASVELRNHIYELATQDEPYGRTVRLKEADVKFGGPHLLRQHLGLTQVSRTVRKEFFPIYSQSYKHEILFGDLPAYLATYPLADTDIMQTMVELVVGLRHNTFQSPGLDIMPLITLDWHALPFQVALIPQTPVHGQSVLHPNLTCIEHMFRRIVHEGVLECHPISMYSAPVGLVRVLPDLGLIESCKIEKQDAQSNLPKVTVVVRLDLDGLPLSVSDRSTTLIACWAVVISFHRTFLRTPLGPEFMFKVGRHCLSFEDLFGIR